MVNFRIRGEAGGMADLRNIVRETNGGRGASSRVDLSEESFFFFFCGRCNTAAELPVGAGESSSEKMYGVQK